MGVDRKPARGSRFVRLRRDPGGMKAFNRHRITDRLPSDQRPRDPYDAGEFLGRLWSLFGPTKEADKGFKAYDIRDTETGRTFSAYSGASGPAYRAASPHDGELEASLVAFESMLASAPPADCAVEYESDFGRIRIGVAGGEPFEEIVAPPRVRPQLTVETVEQCLALVTPKPGDDLMEVFGFWPGLLMTVVPTLQRQRPSFDDLRRDPDAPRIYALFRERNGERLEPIEDLEIAGLPPAGQLWLEAYKRWLAARAPYSSSS